MSILVRTELNPHLWRRLPITTTALQPFHLLNMH